MTQVQFLQSVHDAVQLSSRSRLETFCKIDKVELQIIEELENRKLYTNMSLILLSGKDIKITLKLFFDAAEMSGFLNKLYPQTELEEKVVPIGVDVFKEVLNLIAGHMKILLDQTGIRTEISLPIALRGYDDVFLTSSSQNPSESCWKLSFSGSDVFCSCVVDCKNEQFDQVVSYSDETSDIEFL